MRASGLRPLVSVLVFLSFGSARGADPGLVTRLRAAYDSTYSRAPNLEELKRRRNLFGYLAWDESYLLESLLEMFRATGETSYLDRFVSRADAVMAVRDDRMGSKDWKGRTRPGWSTDAQFTLGIPVTVPDSQGNPSLRVEGSAQRDNNRTRFTVSADGEGTFKISVTNEKKPEVNRVFRGLTLENVESVVNSVEPRNQLIRVRVLGHGLPRVPFSARFDTYVMVNHGLDTPIIEAPFAGFAALVLADSRLTAYRSKAREYIERIEESLEDYAHTWVEKGDRGYYLFEPGEPLWRAGLPVPYNGVALHGILNLLLYQATGKPIYRDRAARLARQVKSGLVSTKAGHYEMKYAFGLAYEGWTHRPDLHFSSYPGVRFGEDTGHFSSTLRFIIAAHRAGLVFDNQDIDRLLATFREVILRDSTFNNSLRSDSRESGRFDWAAGTYVLLSQYSAEILDDCLRVFERAARKESRVGLVLLGWARFTRMAREMD